MKNNAILSFTTVILCWLCQVVLTLPWWSVFLIPLLLHYLFGKKELSSLLNGFISVFFYWFVLALFVDMNNDSILSQKIGNLFMGLGSTGILIVSALFGGIVGGLGAWLGILARKIALK